MDDMRMGTIPVFLFKIIYYILLGFSCMWNWRNWPLGKHDENYGIVEDVNVLFWNLLYAIPFVYPSFDILNR